MSRCWAGYWNLLSVALDGWSVSGATNQVESHVQDSQITKDSYSYNLL